MKGCNVYLASKTVCHKPYRDLQLLLVPTNYSKNLSIDLMIGLPLFADWKSDNYNLILVIINHLIKIIHYKLVKVIINALGLAKVIINVLMQYHSLLNLIISDHRTIFMFKF